MRYFLFIVIGCIVAPLACYSTVMILAPAPILAEYWVNELIVSKHDLAQSYSGKHKAIVVSGSEALFNVDAAALEGDVGFPVLNFGLFAGMPLERILDEAESVAAPGDLVILGLEPQYYCNNEPTPGQIRNSIAWDNAYWRSLGTTERLKGIALLGPTLPVEMVVASAERKFFPGLIRKRLDALDKESILRRFRERRPPEYFAYSMLNLDDHGTILGNHGVRNDVRGHSSGLPNKVCAESRNQLHDFVARLKERNVLPIFINVPYVREDQHDSEARADETRFYQQLAGVACFIDRRDQLFFPRGLFFNSELHLNDAGRAQRTALLGQRIVELGLGSRIGSSGFSAAPLDCS